MRFSRYAGGAALAAIAMSAQATTLRSPVSGYMFDVPKGLVRPVNGLPGAALIGNGLESPAVFAKVVFAPGQRSAVAISREGGTYLIQLDGPQMQTRLLEQVAVSPDLVAFDDAGRFAVLYFAPSRQYRILDAGALGEARSLPELPGSITSFAIGAAGKTLAVAVSTGEASRVFIFEPGEQNARFVSQNLSVATLAFSAAGNELLFPDRGANRVLIARRNGHEWVVEVAADGRDGLDAPAAAEFDQHGGIVILNSGTSEVLVQSGGRFERLRVPAGTGRLERMAAPGVMLLTAQPGVPAGEPAHLLDLERTARVVFVPAGDQQ